MANSRLSPEDIEATYSSLCAGDELPTLMVKNGIVYERRANGEVWAWDQDEFFSLTVEQREVIGKGNG